MWMRIAGMTKPTTAGIEVDDTGASVKDRERQAIRAAVQSITTRETFYPVPTRVAGEILIGYLRTARKPISKHAALVILLEDLQEIADALRRKTFELPNINEPRSATLLHLAAAVGVERVLRYRELWLALKAEDYEAAQDLILRLYWTSDVVDAKDKRGQERICDLARMMRTGELPPKK